MFDYRVLQMIGNYEQRNVANYVGDGFEVDTSAVTDRDYTYEVGVRVDGFRSGRWIIVEGVQTKEEARAAHDKWVDRMRTGVTEIYDIFSEITYRKDK